MDLGNEPTQVSCSYPTKILAVEHIDYRTNLRERDVFFFSFLLHSPIVLFNDVILSNEEPNLTVNAHMGAPLSLSCMFLLPLVVPKATALLH